MDQIRFSPQLHAVQVSVAQFQICSSGSEIRIRQIFSELLSDYFICMLHKYHCMDINQSEETGLGTLCETKSWNYRMFGVGRDLWRSPCPPPLLKQGHPELVA